MTYNWNVGGVAVGTPNSDTYIVDAEETDIGSVIECVASVQDTEGETAESKSYSCIENTEPTVDSVTIDKVLYTMILLLIVCMQQQILMNPQILT